MNHIILTKDTKEQFIASTVANCTQYWINNVLLIGMVLFPLLGFLDFFVVAPSHFNQFVLLRFAITISLTVLYVLNKFKVHIAWQYTIIVVGIALSAGVIEIMILKLGGHASSYYAGLGLVLIAALGLIPLSFNVAFLCVGIVYAIYLVPILAFDKIGNTSQFSMNNAFLIATSAILLALRHLNQKRLINELGLQYELNQEKNKLINYSSDLEKSVDERTRELQKSVQWHTALFENATDGIVILASDGMIINANDKACLLHGFNSGELKGLNIKLLEMDSERVKVGERINRLLQGGDSIVFETKHNKKDGNTIYLEISSRAITIDGKVFIQSFYRDITDKKQMNDYVLQSEKLGSLGLFTSEFVHDFTNLLSVVGGHAEIIRTQIPEDDKKTSKSINIIGEVIQKADRMLKKLLNFSRKTDYETLPLYINDVVNDTIKILEHVIGKSIKLSVALGKELPVIQGDFVQLQQVVMNLITNARDAMPRGGQIDISTRSLEVVKDMPDVPPYVPPGEYVQMSIVDTGNGIPERLLHKIFDPFFTTKPKGKGTGLGLSLIYGIIREHCGYINVQSKLGSGTTFFVYLPVMQGTYSEQPQKVNTNSMP